MHSELSGDRLRQALKEVRVGSWDWHITNGELIWDEAAMELYGTRPEEYTARVENWMRCVHPDDLGPTLALVDQAIRGHSVFEAEYRVRRFDGTYGWHQARGMATYDEQGEPLRMLGMGWDSNESRTARDALSRALRHMSDGFLAVDDAWRITFANLEAERTLGLSEDELFGRVLWDLPTVQELPGLERRCRKAAAEDKPAGFDIRVPGTGRRYHLRLVPGPDGRTLYLQDVTEKRRRGGTTGRRARRFRTRRPDSGVDRRPRQGDHLAGRRRRGRPACTATVRRSRPLSSPSRTTACAPSEPSATRTTSSTGSATPRWRPASPAAT